MLPKISETTNPVFATAGTAFHNLANYSEIQHYLLDIFNGDLDKVNQCMLKALEVGIRTVG